MNFKFIWCLVSINVSILSNKFGEELSSKYWCKVGHFNFNQAKLFHQLCKELQPNYILEIGFCTGRSAASILLSCNPIKFISIDLNLNYMSPYGRIYAKILSDNFKCFSIIEGNSINVLTDNFFKYQFKNGIDWVTVDGGHSYKECISDLIATSKHLKNTGIIVIDDYKSGPPDGILIAEVTKAVDDFLTNNKSFSKIEWNKKGKGFAILFKSDFVAHTINKVIKNNNNDK